MIELYYLISWVISIVFLAAALHSYGVARSAMLGKYPYTSLYYQENRRKAVAETNLKKVKYLIGFAVLTAIIGALSVVPVLVVLLVNAIRKMIRAHKSLKEWANA